MCIFLFDIVGVRVGVFRYRLVCIDDENEVRRGEVYLGGVCVFSFFV